MASFKVGDRVVLRSGGPVMIVTSVPLFEFDKKYTVEWFEGERRRDWEFPPEALRKATKADEQPKKGAAPRPRTAGTGKPARKSTKKK